MRLSNTAIDTYTLCPRKYFLHYVEKIRTLTTKSPLFFGKAIDEALNCFLLTKKKNLTDQEKELIKKNPYVVFQESFKLAEINGEHIHVPLSDRVDYYKSDLDLSLLDETDYNEISAVRLPELSTLTRNDVPQFVEECQEFMKKKIALKGDTKKMYNFISWLSLKRKGFMLIDAFRDQVMPQILEVHDIQTEVMLENSNGNYIIGYIDYIATMSDGKKYIMDNKTSSQAYSEDSVSNSQQLAIYSEFMQIPNCGYSVLHKKLRKKDPKVRTQIILSEISEENYEKVFDKIGEVEYNIENGNFEKNLKNCFHFGSPCPYYKYCRNGDIDGLIKLKTSNDEENRGDKEDKEEVENR